MTVDAERLRVNELLGARDLIQECEQMLHGERSEFTEMHDYLQQRLEYWQERYRLLDLRHNDRRQGERRGPGRASLGRRSGAERRG